MKRVVVATSTFYQRADETRAKLALRTAEEARREGYSLVAVDGGSSEEFIKELDTQAVVLRQETKGMGPGRRQALNAARQIARGTNGDHWAVVWMEPEKWPFVADIAVAAAPVLDNEADLVVPERSQAGWESYPPEQKYSEQIGNLAFWYLTGHYLDIFFGPKVMNENALMFYLQTGKYGDLWGWLNVTPMNCLAAGLRVKGVLVNYRHPPEQTAVETGDIVFLRKRIEQLMNQVPAFEAEAKALGFIK